MECRYCHQKVEIIDGRAAKHYRPLDQGYYFHEYCLGSGLIDHTNSTTYALVGKRDPAPISLIEWADGRVFATSDRDHMTPAQIERWAARQYPGRTIRPRHDRICVGVEIHRAGCAAS